MKKQLLELLGLKPDATDDAVVAAVKLLTDGAAAAAAITAEQAEVNKLIAKSAGGLTERSAREVIRNRAAYAAQNKPAKK